MLTVTFRDENILNVRTQQPLRCCISSQSASKQTKFRIELAPQVVSRLTLNKWFCPKKRKKSLVPVVKPATLAITMTSDASQRGQQCGSQQCPAWWKFQDSDSGHNNSKLLTKLCCSSGQTTFVRNIQKMIKYANTEAVEKNCKTLNHWRPLPRHLFQ